MPANLIEYALTAFLTNDTTVNGIVNGSVQPLRTQQNTPSPRITYERVSATRTRSNNGPTGLCESHIRISCWGDSDTAYVDAKDLADAVRRANGGGAGIPNSPQYATLDGFKGTMNGLRVLGGFLDEDADQFWRPLDAQDMGDNQVSMIWRVWWREVISSA